jgi:hypothetical protein
MQFRFINNLLHFLSLALFSSFIVFYDMDLAPNEHYIDNNPQTSSYFHMYT